MRQGVEYWCFANNSLCAKGLSIGGRKIGSRTETALLFSFSQRDVESRTQASPLNYAREVKTSERERKRERERERERE